MNRSRNRLFSLIILVGTLAVVVPFSSVFAGGGLSPREVLVEGNTESAVKLYGELRKGEGNLFFSTYSISTALAMTYGGARGKTALEMREALHFQIDDKLLHPSFRNLSQEITEDAGKTGQKLTIANGLCLTGGNVSNSYKLLLKDFYDAEFFSGGLGSINNWVKEKTSGKIAKILDKLDVNSVCVILNAVYFKGKWENPFQKNATRDAPFKISQTMQSTVPSKRWA